MSKKSKTETVERLVLVQDPILGSKYELHEVEVEIETTETATKVPKKKTKKEPKNPIHKESASNNLHGSI